MSWRTVAQFCEQALRARGERARVVELERSGWVNLGRAAPAPAQQHGQSAPLGSAPARLLCLPRACLAALGKLGALRKWPAHWMSSRCLGCSS